MKGDTQRAKVQRYRDLLNLRLKLSRLENPDPEALRGILLDILDHLVESSDD